MRAPPLLTARKKQQPVHAVHIIGSPLALASSEYAEKAWVKFEDVAALQRPNIRIIQGSATRVDAASKTATVTPTGTTESRQLAYDFLIAASGLRRAWPVVPQSLRCKQYLFEAGDHIDAVSRAAHGVLVVGGGAVGIEMAAELKLVQPRVRVTLAHSRGRLLSSEGLPDEAKDVALDLLREAGVEVLMNHRLLDQADVKAPDGTRAAEARFTNGHKLLVDVVVMAISKSVPSTAYLPAVALDDEGYIKIQPK